MRTQTAVEFFGGASALASALGIKRQAVYQWGEDVPALRALQLERVTSGELRATPADYEPKAKASATA